MKSFKGFLIILLISMVSINCGEKNKNIITAQGLVDGDVITLKTKVAGTIEKSFIKEGKVVKKGELILSVDSMKTQNKMKEIELEFIEIELVRSKLKKRMQLILKNIKYFSKQVQRFESLNKTKAVSGEKLEQMRLNLDEVKTRQYEINRELDGVNNKEKKLINNREYLNLILRDYIINSPVEGILIEGYVSKGENIFPGSSLADVLDVKSLYVEVFLEENEIANLQLGQSVELKIDGRGERITGKISYFGRKAEFSPKYIISEEERKSLLYQVKVTVQEKDLKYLKLGMILTVTIK